MAMSSATSSLDTEVRQVRRAAQPCFGGGIGARFKKR
jgi:hypothetical protein